MKAFPIYLLALPFVFAACSNGEVTSAREKVEFDTSKNLPVTKPQTSKVAIPDSIERFEVDDYPITNEMLGDDVKGREIRSGDIFSYDKVWFSNDTLQQTMIVLLHTDKFRGTIYHFKNNDIPKRLIEQIEFNTEEGDTVANVHKHKYFKGFLSQSQPIDSRYFKTLEGFVPGDNIDKAVETYGTPDVVKRVNGIDEYYWNFMGDLLYDGKINLAGKRIALNSYGHQIVMFVKRKKIVAMIFHNDIP